jgi:uncharacterized protein YndB with AHSA1/START domain
MSALPPIERSVSVSWDPATAFQRFTEEFGDWWPRATHSVGEGRVRRIVFEARLGGRIFEEHADGRRFRWGEVLALEPPVRLRFSWHPGRAPETAQLVELRFLPEGRGTRLELRASGWENWGRGAARARRGYEVGWGYVLNVWAGRRTARMRLLDAVLLPLARLVQWLRGGLSAAIERAGGEMRP